MSETDASDTSETSSTNSVGTQTRLHSDLHSYNSDGGYVAHGVPCPARPQSLMSRKETEGPMACDRLKWDDGNTLLIVIYEKAQTLVPILATRLRIT